jgi:hypothetical protein
MTRKPNVDMHRPNGICRGCLAPTLSSLASLKAPRIGPYLIQDKYTSPSGNNSVHGIMMRLNRGLEAQEKTSQEE